MKLLTYSLIYTRVYCCQLSSSLLGLSPQNNLAETDKSVGRTRAVLVQGNRAMQRVFPGQMTLWLLFSSGSERSRPL